MDGSEAQERGQGYRGRCRSGQHTDGPSMGMGEVAQVRKRVVSISAKCPEDRLDMGSFRLGLTIWSSIIYVVSLEML